MDEEQQMHVTIDNKAKIAWVKSGETAVASFAFEAFGGPDEATEAAFRHIQGDGARGLYYKYTVERKDGTSAPGEKHHDCDYFVLDMDHDDHARAAILAYVISLENSEEYPDLASDLRNLYL
jgi:hypothetical protein